MEKTENYNYSDSALQPMRLMKLRSFLLSIEGNIVLHFEQTQASTVEDEDRISSIQYPYLTVFS